MEDLLRQATALIAAYGYLIVFLLAAGDNFGLPSAGDIALLAGAAAAHRYDHLEWHWVVAAGFAGGIVADQLSYVIGRYGGAPIVRRFIPQRVREPVELRLHNNLGKTVVSARMLAGFRSAVPVISGVSHVRWVSFAGYNFLAVAIWSLTIGSVGLVFAESLTRAAQYVSAGSKIAAAVVGGLLILVLALVGWRHLRRQRQAGERPALDPESISDEDLDLLTTRELARLARLETRPWRREMLEHRIARRNGNTDDNTDAE